MISACRESDFRSRENESRLAARRHRAHASGQTLIELLIAMTVITVGLMAAAMLVISNIHLQEISADRVIATDLAREGIEFAKAQRDSNWLHGDPFNSGMSGAGPDYTGTPYVASASGQFIGFDFLPDTIGVDTDYTKLVRSTTAATAGRYLQGVEATPIAGAATPFLRLMSFHPICADGVVITADGASCAAPVNHGATVGVRLTSTVRWTKRGTQRESIVVDDIYDWR